MLAKWPIRDKLLIGIGLLVAIVVTLSVSAFIGVYAYRSLVRSLRNRAEELPLATELAGRVSDLRVSFTKTGPLRELTAAPGERPIAEPLLKQFAANYAAVKSALDDYCNQLSINDQEDLPIGNNRREQATVARLRDSLGAVANLTRDRDWPFDRARAELVNHQLELVQTLTAQLPSFLEARLHDLAGEVKTRYRTLIILTWIAAITALAAFGLFVHLFYRWVFRPLRVLIKGSRFVAAGNFGYRIKIDSHDEMSELAGAMNDMTARFQAVRDDLDRQVQIRTKQVVRSEQLASVGFLAAGVAHEINNPLASIAMCAESLEGRLSEIAPAGGEKSAVVGRYLRMIQTEAFRCKEITEKLLDFSRLGDVQHQTTDLRELIQGVIEMVRHLGKYQAKQILFPPGEPVVAPINPQEIKQVVLNLITNALDSVEQGGNLAIELHAAAGFAEMVFSDDGCGMTDEVLEHLFEPFFTRKRGGQGTGLGLSIVYRIVADHGGQIDAASAGPSKGSQFRVTLPLAETHKESSHRYQAA
ncbi:MAG TPA: HAMP domain-containing sensor histidine kinase [Pirellulales bacterium]|nr:HAMP domain-containing sensor histidine kinase [Pirellulales bacterium]